MEICLHYTSFCKVKFMLYWRGWHVSIEFISHIFTYLQIYIISYTCTLYPDMWKIYVNTQYNSRNMLSNVLFISILRIQSLTPLLHSGPSLKHWNWEGKYPKCSRFVFKIFLKRLSYTTSLLSMLNMNSLQK